MAVKRKCVCCGKEYDFCPNCAKSNQPQWMASFCSEPCKGLFKVVSAYNMKQVGKSAVQRYISEHNITGKYTAPIEKVLNEVRSIRDALDGNQKVDQPTLETKKALVAGTVIPMHNMESQSRLRHKRRKRR